MQVSERVSGTKSNTDTTNKKRGVKRAAVTDLGREFVRRRQETNHRDGSLTFQGLVGYDGDVLLFSADNGLGSDGLPAPPEWFAVNRWDCPARKVAPEESMAFRKRQTEIMHGSMTGGQDFRGLYDPFADEPLAKVEEEFDLDVCLEFVSCSKDLMGLVVGPHGLKSYNEYDGANSEEEDDRLEYSGLHIPLPEGCPWAKNAFIGRALQTEHAVVAWIYNADPDSTLVLVSFDLLQKTSRILWRGNTLFGQDETYHSQFFALKTNNWFVCADETGLLVRHALTGDEVARLRRPDGTEIESGFELLMAATEKMILVIDPCGDKTCESYAFTLPDFKHINADDKIEAATKNPECWLHRETAGSSQFTSLCGVRVTRDGQSEFALSRLGRVCFVAL